MQKVIKISGVIEALDGKSDIDHDETLDKIIEFLESNGLSFGGITEPKFMTLDGELVNYSKKIIDGKFPQKKLDPGEIAEKFII